MNIPTKPFPPPSIDPKQAIASFTHAESDGGSVITENEVSWLINYSTGSDQLKETVRALYVDAFAGPAGSDNHEFSAEALELIRQKGAELGIDQEPMPL
jgi:hypothetical protein